MGRFVTGMQPHTALNFEPQQSQQAHRADEDGQLPHEPGRFLQTGQPEDEPYY